VIDGCNQRGRPGEQRDISSDHVQEVRIVAIAQNFTLAWMHEQTYRNFSPGGIEIETILGCWARSYSAD